MGMITTNVLEESLSFGPLPTSLMIGEPAYLIAQTTTDRLSELPTIYADPKRLSDPIRLIEWICNLRCARCPGEQNMELICTNHSGQSFYRTTRRIEAGEELLIWFRRQDLQPLLGEYLNNQTILEAWSGQTVKHSTNSQRRHFENLENLNTQSMNSNDNKFECPKCNSEFIYIYPYISHCLFKCQKQSVTQNIQLINQPPISNPYPNEINNDCLNQTRIDALLHNNNNNNFSNLIAENKSKEVQSMLDKIGEDLSHGTIPPSICSSFINECHKSVRGEATDQGRTNNLEQICELSSKTITSLHKKYLHKLHSNNKMLVNPKTLKQNTIITTNPIEDSHNNVYRKNKMKNNVLPLKTCNPLVEQLLQTLTSSVDNSLSSPELITAPPPPPPTATTTPKTNSSSTIPTGVKQSQPTLLNSLTLAQNWCARCFITFRLTSDLVHHMRTYHNQSGRNTNHNKGRLISHNAHIHSSDKLSRKEIYTLWKIIEKRGILCILLNSLHCCQQHHCQEVWLLSQLLIRLQ
uniref:C2H2-type domain-containing protein n=1 Tax=Trichobilharzia regenti TaxID=157069 RepID=A0AA85IWD7_TRIRE|nr:unnamed protein product [Trichobilharzia regenti]